ncbi:hypothetical protein BYT27DRAFT_7250011 [Phlegmacium glaucopus]|nr:hypothetical protein BYT27DRAFT_7250011 [Phlegmacium glaucopus]
MDLSQNIKSIKHAAEAFRALAFLINDTQLKNTMEIITDMIAKSISTATKRTCTELEDATEQLTEASLIIYTTVNELREEHHSVIVKLKGALEAAEIAGAVEKEGQKRGYTRTNTDGIEESTETYAERTRRFIPTPHAQVVAKAELQKRRVWMTRAVGMEGDRMNELSRKQLVEKANMAIELMDIPASTKPEEASGRVDQREGGYDAVHRQDGVYGGLQSTNI